MCVCVYKVYKADSYLTGDNLKVFGPSFQVKARSHWSTVNQALGIRSATSRVENSAQVSSCYLKFVHVGADAFVCKSKF